MAVRDRFELSQGRRVGIGLAWAPLAIALLQVSAAMPGLAQPVTAEAALEEGLQLAHDGRLEDAAAVLQRAAEASADQVAPAVQIDLLTALARVHLSLGYHLKAAQGLELALALAHAAGDRPREATVMGALGQVYLAVGQFDPASSFFHDALFLARETRHAALQATILNDLGRLQAHEGRDQDSLNAFMESEFIASTTEGLAVLAATAALNAGQASLRLGRREDALEWFKRALARLWALPESHEKANGLTTLALVYAELGSGQDGGEGDRTRTAARVLEEAGEVAHRIGDHRAESYAFGHRGHLYERQGQVEEALLLTRRAVSAAQQVYAPESLYRWEWQTGRLLKRQGRLDEAIAAYRRAAETVQKIRPEMVLTTSDQAASFRESGGRLFFELADLLLERAAAAPDEAAAQPYLVQARQSVELFKSAELRDYFRDDCVDALQASNVSLDQALPPGTAALYPILLADRTEILISFPSGIKRVTVPVTEETMTSEVRAFRRFLEKRTTREYLPHAQQLYRWLIRPIEQELTEHGVQTLVIVPDGSLRTIPLAALHDGERYLIERYAVATSPGLDLTDPRPLQRVDVKILAAGLTEGVQGFPPLPNVGAELEALQELYHSPPLLNQAFLITSFEQQLRDRKLSIVHIASHAKFESRVQDSFLLTFDDKMTMDLLNRYIGYFRFREEPLELLTLSACETAAGDDRAALGLAGVAIKAGARSALATLWFINDAASSELVARFYRELQNPEISKAQALQRAQLSLLKDPFYRHPAYWAPFLLLNNWL